MEGDFYHNLIREIEIAKGRLTGHELECLQRYKNLDERHARFEESQAAQNRKLELLLTKVDDAKWTMNWKAWGVASLVFTIMLGLLSWTGSRLYAMHDSRAVAGVEKTR